LGSVESSECLVEKNEADLGIAESAGDPNTLPLAPGDSPAAFAQRGQRAFGKALEQGQEFGVAELFRARW
jgi:hypothetical protein